MENYIVSARKYRPSTFELVVGQRALTTTLKNAILSQKLAHAYLFCGPRGVGKTTCARIFAKTINCQHQTPAGEACNECESCVAFNDQRSYNIHELDAASNNSVEDIRSLIEQVRIPPQIGKYKVYIIDEVHMLSQAAFNAFLKTLEEPPKHAIFILATTEKHKILPTILSRCQIYDFNRISVSDMVDYLQFVAQKEGISVEAEALNVIAQKADGGMRDALSIFDQVVSFTGGNIRYDNVIENLNVLDYEYYFRLTDCFLTNRIGESLLIFNSILNKGFEGSHFITGLASHFRDLLVSKDPATLTLLEVGTAIQNRYQEQAQKCPVQFLYQAMKLCNDCDLNYRVSKNKRLLVELTLIQLGQLNTESSNGPEKDHQQSTIKPISSQQPDAQPTPKTIQAQAIQPGNTSSVEVKPQPTAPLKPISQPKENIFSSIPRNPIPSSGAEGKKIPTLKAGSLGLSIKKPIPKPTDEKEKGSVLPAGTSPDPTENYIFNEKDLNYYWREFASSLPPEEKATAGRMMNMNLKLLNDTTFEATVDNELAEKYMKNMVAQIEAYLRQRLHNHKITMTLRVNAPTENVRAYSRVERFQLMSQKNPNLLRLKDEFGLELH